MKLESFGNVPEPFTSQIEEQQRGAIEERAKDVSDRAVDARRVDAGEDVVRSQVNGSCVLHYIMA